jgi:hypothetical protein
VYIKIRSWHVIGTPTRMFNTYKTLCGRRAVGEPAMSFGDERTCETCLRIMGKQAVEG